MYDAKKPEKDLPWFAKLGVSVGASMHALRGATVVAMLAVAGFAALGPVPAEVEQQQVASMVSPVVDAQARWQAALDAAIKTDTIQKGAEAPLQFMVGNLGSVIAQGTRDVCLDAIKTTMQLAVQAKKLEVALQAGDSGKAAMVDALLTQTILKASTEWGVARGLSLDDAADKTLLNKYEHAFNAMLAHMPPTPAAEAVVKTAYTSLNAAH